MPKFNAEILTVARGACGVSQAELARLINWSQGKLSKVEHGLIEVDESEAALIGKTLGYPAALFYLDSAAAGFGSCCIDRRRMTTPLRDVNQLHDRVNIWRMQIARLIRSIELPHAPAFPELDIDKYSGPEEVARMVRAAWRLPLGPIRNLMDVVERAGAIIKMADLHAGKIDAVSQRAPDSPPLIFLDRSKPVDRQRFSLAHEVAHIVMHSLPTLKVEEEADQFASELLMPARDIYSDLTNLSLRSAAALKLKWRVSIAALVRRAVTLGTINASRYKSLCVQLSKMGYRTNEPNPLRPEHPKMLGWLIDVFINQRGYSIQELSSAMLCTEQQLKRDYGDYLGGDEHRLGIVG